MSLVWCNHIIPEVPISISLHAVLVQKDYKLGSHIWFTCGTVTVVVLLQAVKFSSTDSILQKTPNVCSIIVEGVCLQSLCVVTLFLLHVRLSTNNAVNVYPGPLGD